MEVRDGLAQNDEIRVAFDLDLRATPHESSKRTGWWDSLS